MEKFIDRWEAGIILAQYLNEYRNLSDVIVLALPRGGVPVAYEIAQALSSLGAFLRCLKSRMGSPKAITARAHKLAVIIYNMFKNKQEYIKTDQHYYEQKFKERLIKSLTVRAKSLGFDPKI